MTSMMTISAGSFGHFALDGTMEATSEGCLRDLPARVSHLLARFNLGRSSSMGGALLPRRFKEIRDKKQTRIILAGLTFDA